jgi:hypothetical protein
MPDWDRQPLNSIKFDIRSNFVEFYIEFTFIFIIESNRIELFVNSIRFGSIGALEMSLGMGEP